MQAAENKTFYGAPLMPEANIFDKTPPPNSERYWSSVRPASRIAAQTLNKLSGGDKVFPGKIDISPEVLDLVFDTMTGGIGRFVSDTVGLPGKTLFGEAGLRDIPMARRVLGSKSRYKATKDYQDNITYIMRLREQAKAYPKERREIMKDRAWALYGKARKYESRIKKLRKIMKTAKNDTDRDRIKERIERVKESFNKLFNDRMAG